MESVDANIERRNFLISLLIVFLTTLFLTLTTVWQIVIISAIIGGIINDKARKSTLSGAIGIPMTWLVYMIYFFVTKNMYLVLDQFAAVIIGNLGYGWIILVIILLIGLLIGALGGYIGNAIKFFYTYRIQTS